MCPTWTQTEGDAMNNEEKILRLLEEMKTEQTEMRDLMQKVAVTQEAVVLPRLNLLAEGHQNLLDTLAIR